MSEAFKQAADAGAVVGGSVGGGWLALKAMAWLDSLLDKRQARLDAREARLDASFGDRMRHLEDEVRELRPLKKTVSQLEGQLQDYKWATDVLAAEILLFEPDNIRLQEVQTRLGLQARNLRVAIPVPTDRPDDMTDLLGMIK